METKYRNYAFEFMQAEDISVYDAILTVSGDGLIHEIINGLFLRPDYQEMREKGTLPSLGFLPGGTSDGMGKTVLNESHEEFSLENMVWLVIKGQDKMIDINEFEIKGYPRKVYSFMSGVWGWLADVDLESEVLRCLGELRLYIFGILRILSLRRYGCKLSFKKNGKWEDGGVEGITNMMMMKVPFVHRDMLNLPPVR
jgi:sphingosine kinase